MWRFVNNIFFIEPSTTIREAMFRLNQTQGRGLVVVNSENYLLGMLTDGDIRRFLLRNGALDEPIENAMCKMPLVSRSKKLSPDIYEKAKRLLLKIVPILDSNDKVSDLFFMDGYNSYAQSPVVIMVGGLGSRLGNLTKDCPKPMLKVGGKPLLEIILGRLVQQGFSDFYFAVNYKAEVIEQYFGNGEKFGCSIQYLREEKRLGTAGALSLLPQEISTPIVVMNGDLLTKVDFRYLSEFHMTHASPLTVCVRKYDFQVPYGVINIDSESIRSLDEKPTHSFFVNAGVYVIDAALLKHIPFNEYYDMTTFVNYLISRNTVVSCFPIFEKWIDIGHVDDLNSAREDHDF